MARHSQEKKGIARWLLAALIVTFAAPIALPAASTTVASLSPNTGFNGGGYTIEATGTDFTGSVSAVSIVGLGLSVSASFTVDSATSLSIAVPAITVSDRVTGTVSVRVHLADGTEIDTDFGFEASDAQSLAPSSGSAAGGTELIITGKHFEFDVSGSPQVMAINLASTSLSFAASMSFTVSSSTEIVATIPSIPAASRSATVFDVVIVYVDGTQSVLNFEFLRPTLTSVTPEYGSPAGGTSITISGTGFYDGGSAAGVTELRIGSETITDFTVISDTTITATLPLRSGNSRTIGDKKFFLTTAISSSGDVYFSFIPSRDSSKDNATAVSAAGARVVLGELASRSQGKPIVRSGDNPYFVDGTDGITGLPYRYRTNAPYTHTPNQSSEQGAYERESTEASTSATVTGTISSLQVTIGGRSQVNAIKLVQNSNCTWTNNRGGYYSFCSAFGPEFYTEAFYATDDQALSFDWYAQGDQDDYEIYAYLVAVPDDVTIPTPSAGNHTLAAHGMGYRSATNFWETSTANIPADGLYRFRFVNGSYDGTGGKVLGSTFYVGSIFTAGARNAIEFGPISDQVLGVANSTFDVTATSDSGNRVDIIVSNTSTVCSVTTSYAVPTTTVTVTKKTTGTCTLIASQTATDGFATPASEVVSFRILTAATTASAPAITSITPDNAKLTVNFTRPAFDGGSPITNYEYSIDNGANWTAFSPANTTSFQVAITGLSNGTTYPVRIRAVTSLGGGAPSAAVNGTPIAIAAPNIAYSPITQSMTVNAYGSIVRPANTGGAVAGYTISSGALPAGLSLNTSTGFISGTPTVTGSSTVYIEAFNSGGTSSPTVLTITVIDVPPVITYTPSTVTLTRNSPMTPLVPTFTGGPLTDSATVVTYTGAIPPGLSLNSQTGEITGTPSTTNTTGVTLQIRANGYDNQISSAFALTIKVYAIAPSISYSASQVVTVGTSFTIQAPTLDASTDAPATFAPLNPYSITPALPSGVSLNTTTGIISGTATSAVVNTTVSYTVQANNSGGSGTASLTIYYAPATPGFKYNPTTVSGAAGVAVSATPTTTSANSIVNAGTLTFVISPSLPAGLSINSSTGAITGVPSAGLSTTSYVVTATNILGASSTSAFVLVISEYAPDLLPYTQATYSLRVGVAVSITAPTNNGGPANWTATPTLPAGLSINLASGAISGTPTAITGMVLYTVLAENATGTSSALISIEVLPPLEVPSTTTPTPVPQPLVPQIDSIVPSTVTVDGGETVTVRGRGFGNAEELSVGGETVQLLSSTNNELKFVMPPMHTGIYDMLYMYSGGSRLTYLRAMTVVPKSLTSADSADLANPATPPVKIALEAWQKPWRAKAIVNSFAPGRSVLTPALKSLIRQHIRTYSRFSSHIECVGFTMGPTVLRVDAALSVARAKAVCDYIAQLRPRIKVEAFLGRQEIVVADRVRRVEIDFFRPDTRPSN